MSEGIRVLYWSLGIGAIATPAGLAVAACVQAPGLTLNEAWAAAGGALSVTGGCLVVAMWWALDRRKRRHA